MSDTLCGGLVGSIRLDVAVVDELLVFSIREVAALLFVVGVDDGFSVCSVVVGEAWSGVGCRGTISDTLRTDAHGGNARRASLWGEWRNVVVAFTVRSVQRPTELLSRSIQEDKAVFAAMKKANHEKCKAYKGWPFRRVLDN